MDQHVATELTKLIHGDIDALHGEVDQPARRHLPPTMVDLQQAAALLAAIPDHVVLAQQRGILGELPVEQLTEEVGCPVNVARAQLVPTETVKVLVQGSADSADPSATTPPAHPWDPG